MKNTFKKCPICGELAWFNTYFSMYYCEECFKLFNNDDLTEPFDIPDDIPEWISVEDRIPVEGDYSDYLVTDGESLAVGCYRHDVKAWDSCDFGWLERYDRAYPESSTGIKKVTHWTRIPNFPKSNVKKKIYKNNSIFLAGPSYRNSLVTPWRVEATSILRSLGFDGDIYNPENTGIDVSSDYEAQVKWEFEHLSNAGVVAFWVPRSKLLPGFTTNVEFGYWVRRNPVKMFYGRPDDAERVRYLDYMFKLETGKEVFNDLKCLLSACVDYLNFYDKLGDSGGVV